MAQSENAVFFATYCTATAGTASALTQNVGATAQRAKAITVRAKGANTGTVYLGASDVSSTVNEGLLAGESLSITAVNWLDVGNFYIDVSVNGEGVDVYGVKA